MCDLLSPVCLFTSLQLADGHHAVIGRRLPQSQRLIVADGGADGEEGVRGQTPDLSLHVTLHTHTHTHNAVPADTARLHQHAEPCLGVFSL